MGLYRSVRHRINPIRDAVLKHFRMAQVQRSVRLAPEDLSAKRKRWHVVTDLIHEECPPNDVVVVELGVHTGVTSAHLMKYCPQISVLYGVDLEHEGRHYAAIIDASRVVLLAFLEGPSVYLGS